MIYKNHEQNAEKSIKTEQINRGTTNSIRIYFVKIINLFIYYYIIIDNLYKNNIIKYILKYINIFLYSYKNIFIFIL